MPLLGTAGANAALNGLDGTGSTNVIGYTSLHTASPGSTGANEYAGVARQATAWNAASAAAKTNSGALTFSTSGASAVTHTGHQSAASAGSYGIGAALSSSVTAVTIVVAAGALSIAAA